MRQAILLSAFSMAIFLSPVLADDIKDLKQQLALMKKDYEQRIQALEQGLREAQEKATKAQAQAEKTAKAQQQVAQTVKAQAGQEPVATTTSVAASAQNAFNPAISVILDGTYAAYENDPENYEIPGFPSGGHEGGLIKEGFAIGHTEISFSASVDQLFYGKLTLAVADHEGSTEVELEEAYVETLGLGHGFNVKAGRFYSAIGYLNQQHAHEWDFTDAPLIYRGLFGNQLLDDGIQFNYLVPTDTYFLLGAELASGSRFPGSGNHSGVGAWTVFANIGGDIGVEHSWQIGLSHWEANDVDGRESGGHSHGHEEDGHEEEHLEIPSFTGESKINGLNLVYKWAPNGNPRNQNFKLQFEYFDRNEDGVITMIDSDPQEMSSYDGHQYGWYAQARYQFRPQWSTALRYDQLGSNNRGSDEEILAEAGLDNEEHTPKRYSAVLDWLPSEFSRLRLQYNRDESYGETDNQIFLQYTMSLGSHGGHRF